MSMVSEPEPSMKIVEDATCTFCGCLCDDIALSIEANRITGGEKRLRAGRIMVLAVKVTSKGRPV